MSLFLSCQIPLCRFTNLGTVLRKLRNFPAKADVRHMSQEGGKRQFVPFLDMVDLRRNEAQRSILVQVQSARSYKELYTYCSSVGTVKDMLHYTVGVEPMNFIIVEFAHESDVANILASASHIEDAQIVPIHSQFLWFKAANRKLPKLKQTKESFLTAEDGNKAPKDDELRECLLKSDTISTQMTTLYQMTKLNDLGTRLRFLTARQVELSVTGMFPDARALPFGSSVNGFGRMGCDLDLVLRLAKDDRKAQSRLVFHCKASSASERSMSQRNMETIADLVQLFLPGCAQVRKILQARVPIIKYYQQLTDVECDLSMANMSGVYMSDFLYMMGEIDDRVRPLVFAVRKWASDVALTSSSPGRWITNFSLTLLVLAFLQKPKNSQPLLPSLNDLYRLAGPRDKFVTEDGINCTFLRDLSKLKVKSSNGESVSSLLIEFFEFCSLFPFESRAISLNEGTTVTKPEHNALYIVNPLERSLNVSKNVSYDELERFRTEAKNAAWILESHEKNNKFNSWGLLSLFEQRKKPSWNFALIKPRLMDVRKIFDENEKPVDFKNDNIRKQVEKIKRETENKIELQKLNNR